MPPRGAGGVPGQQKHRPLQGRFGARPAPGCTLRRLTLPPVEATPDVLRALQADLRGLDLRTDALTRGLYSTDGSMYQVPPVAVFFPKHKDEVQACVEACVKAGVPILPRGAGSSLSGQTVNAAVVLDFSRHLSGIVSVDVEARTARVQPGLVLDALSKRLAPHGLMVGPDPASSSPRDARGHGGLQLDRHALDRVRQHAPPRPPPRHGARRRQPRHVLAR